MLTVDQIKNVSFRKANIGGYRPDDVDSFIDEVVNTFESMKKEKADLVGKMEILMKRIEEYRQDEDSVHNALVSAQKLADQSIKEAQEQAQDILNAAKIEADRVIADANGRIILEKEMIVKIQQEAADIRSRMIEAYESQIEALNSLPDQIDVENVREDLAERYPTEVYTKAEEYTENETSEDVFTSIDDAVESATSDNDAKADLPEGEDSGAIQIEKSAFERKFGKLKFGDDYDVASE